MIIEKHYKGVLDEIAYDSAGHTRATLSLQADSRLDVAEMSIEDLVGFQAHLASELERRATSS